MHAEDLILVTGATGNTTTLKAIAEIFEPADDVVRVLSRADHAGSCR